MKFILTDAFPEDRIDVVNDPDRALELVSHGSYDLYLLDLYLPGTDGAELCRLIKNTNSESPVIFVSGAVRRSDKLVAHAAGGDGFLSKPFDSDELVRLVKAHLPAVGTVPDRPSQKRVPVRKLIRLAA
jgi:two-component system response regulator RegX3